MEQKAITYKRSRISYLRFGKGPKTAFCFHGYGENAGSYAFLEDHAADLYSFYSIDLPFHGNTDWKEGLDFGPDDLLAIVRAILAEDPQQKEAGRFTLMGFSLGGRMALTLYQLIPSEVEKMILLAPDGLKVNFWYWLSTQTWPGNRLFRLTMKYPGWFFGLLRALNALKLVNASIFKFVRHYIGDKEVRELLYNRWTALRHIKPDLPSIKEMLRQNGTRIKLLYGKHDRIILSSVGQRFRKGIEEYCELMVLHSGHQVLHEKHIKEIMPALQS